MHNGYLIETGWLQNFSNRNPVDINGDPIPWTTYSFIHFIKDYLKPEMELFEFGSGNSTLFFASLVDHVYTVEHDRKWFDKLKSRLPENSTAFFRDLDNGYETCIRETNKNFDVIFVDGRKRNKCIKTAVHCLKKDGILVLDDSERSYYREGINFLLSHNFKKIEFWGISHRYFHNKATAVFYKTL
jgi:hypothetical protein